MVKTNFITENGIILDVNGKVICKVPGHPSHVNFPEETIWKLHKLNPGFIDRLVHTHPTGMFGISSTDRVLLKSLAMALSPLPIRLSTLTTDNGYDFWESVYVARLEPKECWKERKERLQQSVYREVQIELEEEIQYQVGIDNNIPRWVHELIEISFNEGKHE